MRAGLILITVVRFVRAPAGVGHRYSNLCAPSPQKIRLGARVLALSGVPEADSTSTNRSASSR